MSTKQIVGILLRHKGLLSLLLTVWMALVAGVVFWMPRVYRSQGELLVRLGRENAMVDPTATVGQPPVVAISPSRENEINSAVEIIKSRVIAEGLVDAFGPRVICGEAPFVSPGDKAGGAATASTAAAEPQATPEERNRAVTVVMKSLSAEAVKKSNVILIGYDGPSPDLCRGVLSRLIDLFLDRHIAANRAPRAHEFLVEQTGRLRTKLKTTGEKLRDLKNETGLSAPEVQRQIVVTRIGRLRDELLQAMSDQAAAEAEIRMLRDKLAHTAETGVISRTRGVAHPGLDGMQNQLYALQIKELELLTKLPEQHPEMRLLRQQIAAAKKILAEDESAREQVTVAPNRMYEETRLALLKQEPASASQRARTEALRAQVADEESRLRTANENSLRVAEFQREFELQEASYRKYADSFEQTQIDRALELERISNVSIIQPATYETKAVRPRPVLYLAVGFMGALVACFLLAFRLDSRIRSAPGPDDREFDSSPIQAADKFALSPKG